MKLFRELFSPFSWRLAYRDARPQWKSLLLYTSSMIAGIAALVAILSFRNDVLLTIDDQSRELLGADLEIETNVPYPDTLKAIVDSLGGTQSTSVEFNSMVLFHNTGNTRLSQIRAVNGGFPFYGSIETVPERAASEYQDGRHALVEQSAMRQFGVSVGDSIQVGQVNLKIVGELLNVPGEAAAFSLIGPRVYIPGTILDETGLLERGSRVEYKTYFQFDGERDTGQIRESLRELERELNIDIDTETVASTREDFEEVANNLSRFLGLIAFIALFLGGLGVMSAIYVYIKRKFKTVATLRCLGVSKEKLLAAFTIQIAVIGFMGALLGSIIGIFIQLYIPSLFTGLLPFEIVQSFSFSAVALGLVIGLSISLIFSLIPLITISTISPLLTLRTVDFSPLDVLSQKMKWGTVIGAFVTFTLIVGVLVDNLLTSLAFSAGMVVCIIILWMVAWLLTKLIQSLRLKSFSYTVRQGMANLFRPNNQTSLLIITLGMGMLLIGTLYMSQDMLLQRIDFETGEQTPDLVFYDIQPDQNEEFKQIVDNSDARLILNVPIVSMRLSEINGESVQEIRSDTTRNINRWALMREYRVTYRDYLTDSETVIEGEWVGEANGINSVVPISIANQIDEDLNAELGDTLTFDVQGVPVTTVVASIREVDFQRPEPNFFVLFPKGVLEPAPQFYASTVRSTNTNVTADLQQQVVSRFPNISAIDISIAIQSIREFLDKIALAVQFMAFFSIFTGFIVLGSSIAISRKQRTHESVLLRTLGAEKTQIGTIQTIEYAMLGLLSGLSGLLLAVISSWLLAYFYFDLLFIPDLLTVGGITLFVILSAVAIGWSGSRHIFKHSPLEILRLETG